MPSDFLSNDRPMSPPETSEEIEQRRARMAEIAHTRQPGIVREFWGFLCHNKKWWLLPLLAILALVAIIAVSAPGALTPLIYPLI